MGFLLAQKLGWKYVDLDTFIEMRMELSIPEIFRRYGEKEFRQLETSALIHHRTQENLIIACGGGGIPVVTNRKGELRELSGVYSVIDKDHGGRWKGCKRSLQLALLHEMQCDTLSSRWIGGISAL